MFGPLFTSAQEERTQRARQNEIVNYGDNSTAVAGGAGDSVLCKTVDGGSYPSTAQAVYFVSTCSVLAAEIEGSAATYYDDTGTFPALNLGTNVPPVGTRVICTSVGGFYCFKY